MNKGFGAEIGRLTGSWQLYVSVLGVAAAFFFSLEWGGLKPGILDSFIAALIGSGIHLAAIFCAFAFAPVFCEDFEHGYCYYTMIRESPKRYVITKALLIYLSSVLVMVAGTAVFLGVCAGRLPWTVREDSAYRLALRSNYGILVANKRYVGYCLLYALQIGMYFGSLALAAAFLSLFSVNRMLVLIFPLFLDQLLTELPTRNAMSYTCFTPFLKHFRADWQMLLYAALWSLLPALLLTVGIYAKVKRKIMR